MDRKATVTQAMAPTPPEAEPKANPSKTAHIGSDNSTRGTREAVGQQTGSDAVEDRAMATNMADTSDADDPTDAQAFTSSDTKIS